MKTTIEVADDLFLRAQRLIKEEGTTFRAITEEGLRLVLQRRDQSKTKAIPPLITMDGNGLTHSFKDASWERIRNEIYSINEQ